MAGLLGTDGVAFSTCSLTLPDGQQCDDATPTLRHYTSLWQAAQENADSRVWVGYHFRRASEVGLDHGRQIGKMVLVQELQPARGGSRREV